MRTTSSGNGSLTLRISSACRHNSPLSTSSAPAAANSSSLKLLPPPAPVSTRTWWPASEKARAPAGVRAIRCSPTLISFGTPTTMWSLCARWRLAARRQPPAAPRLGSETTAFDLSWCLVDYPSHMSGRDYAAIIVGASFAGLAVARRLPGRVLLLDRHEVGAVQTSACGTPLWVPQALGVANSVLQVHDKLTVRAPTRSVTYDLSAVPFCTFDYRRFCEGLLEQTRARFLRASVTGVEDGAVRTSEGRFTAPIVVDCSGWRGALVNDGAPASPGEGHFSFGLETKTDLS